MVAQGYQAFRYEAKAMVVATSTAVLAFAALAHTHGPGGGPFGFSWSCPADYTLRDIWTCLVVLQAVRAASFVAWVAAPWGLSQREGRAGSRPPPGPATAGEKPDWGACCGGKLTDKGTTRGLQGGGASGKAPADAARC